MSIPKYDHKKIEAKWQKYWQDNNTFLTPEEPVLSEKQYILDMFPYPSGAGLHVGHPEGYTATDILARFLRMRGKQVLHPMGWDAFGLPAENYAIKQGVHPQVSTKANIERFTEQIKSIGLSYDWNREISTADPSYYKWTQWLFLLLYESGLAYKKEASVNWCPQDNTVLANEQVVGGKCERCGREVVQKKLAQWFFKITEYAERLLVELDNLDWPEPIKAMQRNWIGKKTGININYEIKGKPQILTCFTTRPDTNFGATFVVIGPEHDLLEENNPLNIDKLYWEKIQQYKIEVSKKTELQRISIEKEKTGVFTGLYCINFLNGKEMPLYVADYVLGNVGTGAVVGVPGHDKRDFEFAKQYNIEVIRVVAKDKHDVGPIETIDQVQEDVGIMINSDFLNGLDIRQATDKIMDYIEESGHGKRVINYKLRDWLVSRQRYWGAPIPIIYCEDCGMVPVPEKDLPVLLPSDVDFLPTGESPLKRSPEFSNTKCPKCDGKAFRDADTMDTFVDSSWYFFRYTDPENPNEFASSKKIKSWLPVDTYVGGAEHAVLHLLYSRFFTKVLYDKKYIDFEEPFLKLRNQGLILGPDGEKMSKSRGNVINPDDIINDFGADSLRLYEMFMGPLEDAKPWNTNGLIGLRRFLERTWLLVYKNKDNDQDSSEEIRKKLHKLIKKITLDIESFSFNTAISSFMTFYNEVKDKEISRKTLKTILILLYPFAPHITEELNLALGNTESLQKEKWPDFDPAMIEEAVAVVAVQVAGKLRGTIEVSVNISDDELIKLAQELSSVKKYLSDQEIKKTIVIPNKLINFVI